jgi:hypothetical protein
MPQFFIQQGVRRCVAAREAGLSDILAIIDEPGHPPRMERIPLADLHSPKLSILRDSRYIRFCEYPTKVLKTQPPPIEVEPLGLPRQKKSVPVLNVKLT